MENTVYVSFGDSRKYVAHVDAADKNPFRELRHELSDYLRNMFPEVDSFDFYTTPEITPADEEKNEMPPLDAEAIEEIKVVLAGEIRNMQFQKSIDRNAPWAQE